MSKLQHTFFPRFSDTDALGHINNSSYFNWMEDARRPIFEMFVPDLNPKNWNLIIARIELDFMAQGDYKEQTLVTTEVEKIGNSSFNLIHKIWQKDQLICQGKAILVYFDYQKNQSQTLPSLLRTKLEQIK
jgi:acyl-CoA thioester hydrolase